MHTPSVRLTFIVTALLIVTSASSLPIHAAQNPITAAREAFRKAQEEAKRKAQEEAQRRSGQAPAPGQPAAQAPAAQSGAPAAAPGSTANGGASAPAGTAETTATLAKAAGFMDVGGLKLGMPLQDVEAAIRALNPALKAQAPNVVVVWPYDENDTTKAAPADAPRSVQTVEYQAPSPRGATEVVQLELAVYPNPAVVFSINRSVRYEQGKGPSIEAVAQSLRAKYGAESIVPVADTNSSVIRSTSMRWIYESGNQALHGNLATRMRTCHGGGVSPGDGTPCESLIVLDASVNADGTGVVTLLSMRAASYPMRRSAGGATDAYLRQVSEERAKKQRDESSKRAVPKL